MVVSSLGMGCVTFGREIDRDTSFAVMDHALERGINLFDSAAAYAAGASEKVVGEWLKDRGVRDDMVLATKVNGRLTRGHVTRSAEESLRRLQTERIDLFQLHSWDGDTPLEETLEALSSLVDQGKVRAIGCSNWSARQLGEALSLSEEGGFARVESVQPPYNLVQREIESGLLPLCREQGMATICYSPLAAGFLTGKYRRDQHVPGGTRFDIIPGHQDIYFNDRGFGMVERLEQAAKQSGLSMVQLALGWVLSRSGVTSVLIGARNTGQVDQAFEAAQADLGEELLASLDADG
jgi:aryl-alcohol dehydrogenase-like predicted oxidoreductase